MDRFGIVYVIALAVCAANMLWLLWRDWRGKGEPMERGTALVRIAAALIPLANAIVAICLIVHHACRLFGITLDHVQDWLDRPVFRGRAR